MKRYGLQIGLTLVEMLVSVTIVAVLVSIVLSVAVRIESKAKEQLAESSMSLLNTALKQYQDYGHKFSISTISDDERDFYFGLKFPPDCNDFDKSKLEGVIEDFLDQAGNVDISNGAPELNDSGCEALYFFLSRIPECRKTLAGIDETLLINEDLNKDMLIIEIGSPAQSYPLMRIVDPWGTTLNYDYYDETEVQNGQYDDAEETMRNFPLITSAGPDKVFHTADDITNRIKTKSTEKL